MSRIEQIVMTHFDHNDFNLKNVINFLEENDTIRWEIFREVEREYHREDVLNAIDEYNEENDTDLQFTEKEIDFIVEDYEDTLSDFEDWRYHLNNALIPYIEDKKKNDNT